MPRPDIALVVNGRAGRGRVGRQLPRLLSLVESRGIRVDVRETEHAGHAMLLAREAALDGVDTVVAVGGDGTVNEVVNGLLDEDGGALGARLGVVAAGSGCDFARTFDLPARVDSDLRGIVGPDRPLDVGRLVCASPTGPVVRHFVNVAEAGMAADTVERAERLPRWLGRSRYLVAFVPSLLAYRPTTMTITTPDGQRFSGIAHNTLMANAEYFGGGMHVSPDSSTSDGIAEIQISIGPKRQALTLIPRMFRGTHLPNRRIVEMSAGAVTIDSDEPVRVEADGELVGTTPVQFTMLRGALELVGAGPPTAA